MNPVERFEALLAQGKDNALLRFGLGSQYLQAGDAARAAEGRLEQAVAAYRSGIGAADRHGDKQASKEMTVFLRRLEKEG